MLTLFGRLLDCLFEFTAESMTKLADMIACYFRGMPLHSVVPRRYSSGMQPAQLIDQLRSCVDFPQRDLLSLGGYAGRCPLLGTLSGAEFELLPRRMLFFNTALSPSIIGSVEPSHGGTHITSRVNFGNGGMAAFVRVWLRVAASALMVMAFSVLWTDGNNEVVMAAAIGLFCFGMLVALWQSYINWTCVEIVHRHLSQIAGYQRQ